MLLIKIAVIEVLKLVKPLSITAAIEFKYGEVVVQDSDIYQVVAPCNPNALL